MKLECLFPSMKPQDLRARWLAGEHHVEHGDLARLDELLDIPLTIHELAPRVAYHCTFSAFEADSKGELVPLHGISADHAMQLFDRGYTIQCAGAYPGSRSAAIGPEICRQLGIPHASTSIRYIFSPAGAADAFGWHFDTANVIAVQLRGTKRWQLARNDDVRFPHRAGHPSQPVRGPLNNLPGFSPPSGYGPRYFDKSALANATSVELAPGSVLYNPGGLWHRTSGVGGEGSCSISFLFEPDSWLKLFVRGLTSALMEDATWREPALQITAPGHGRSAARAAFADRLERLAVVVRGLTAEALLERAYDSQLSHLADDAAWFRLDPTATASIERAADGSWRLCVVSDGSETDVELGDSLVTACQWILASESVPFSTSALLLATSLSPQSMGQDRVERVVALLSALDTLGVVERIDGP